LSQAAQTGDQRNAIHVRHVEIGDDQVRLLLLAKAQALHAIVRREDLIAGGLQRHFDGFPDAHGVIHGDYGFGHGR
jgi:hypothetical protein